MLSACPAMEMDCANSENDCGGKGVLPFPDVELVAQSNMGPVIVSVTGHADAKQFLRNVLRKAGAST